MKKLSIFFYYWVPPLVWMIVIFNMSSRPHFGITNTFLYDFLIFKLLHMIEYGFLYFLLLRATYKTQLLKQKKAFFYAFAIALLYAITDEIHQRFVPTREGRLRDVVIDTAGMTIMYIILKYNLEFIKKYL